MYSTYLYVSYDTVNEIVTVRKTSCRKNRLKQKLITMNFDLFNQLFLLVLATSLLFLVDSLSLGTQKSKTTHVLQQPLHLSWLSSSPSAQSVGDLLTDRNFFRLSANNNKDYGMDVDGKGQLLERIMRFRGRVDTGYGRGGKQLGFPTANLPSSLFQDALESVETGVYFGWAVIEDSGEVPQKGRNMCHKAVVNIGYSPTFEGQENKEKIIEAYLILGENEINPPDFYSEMLSLQLHGSLRPEMKFPSFPDLIAQINKDVQDAKDALDAPPSRSLQLDSFLLDACKVGDWIGRDGGDANASWEL